MDTRQKEIGQTLTGQTLDPSTAGYLPLHRTGEWTVPGSKSAGKTINRLYRFTDLLSQIERSP
jgi:hypothetical protein